MTERRTQIDAQLGPYRIDGHIGHGGMADVWHARHVEHDVEVAVKVLRAAPGEETDLRFRREIRAVAMLDHPRIVRILDYGTVPDGLPAEHLPAGSLYFVMEHADAPGLVEAMSTGITWTTIRNVLRATLRALAHAHARGVIHRDLKPENILGFSNGHWKLADFGISALRETDSGRVESNPSGTPMYMSPEQFRGMFRDMGPWTDLYSLGCMAWQLTTGDVPFRGESTIDLARKHLVQTPPEYRPLIPVPVGFGAWVRRLLAKVPHDRYTRAADAAHALGQLQDPDSVREAAAVNAAPATLRTPGLGETVISDDLLDAPSGKGSDASDRESGEATLSITPPAIPDDWRGEALDERSPLEATSPRLVGLRWSRMVGREEERDAMWSALTCVVDGGRGALLLHGAAGCGKSRLARWLCERAHEVGAATPIRAAASREFSAEQTPPGALAEHLGFTGLDGEEAHQRLERLGRQFGWNRPSGNAMWETLQRFRDSEAPSPDWIAACDDVLTAMARHRPLIVWVDDLQWAPRWGTYLDREETPPGVLFVATVRAEDARDGRVVEVMDRLRRREDTTTLDVDELPITVCATMVSDLLHLDYAVAQRIAERADGNPMFATQLVTDWINQRLLVARPHGWELRAGAEPPVPEDITRVWADRVDHLLEGRPVTLRRGLELAAVLGRTVRRPEYDAARAPTMPAWETIGEILGAEGLALRTDDEDLEFVHAMLREAIVAQAADHNTTAVMHRLAAEGLQKLERQRQVDFAARIGRHLFRAGRLEEAIEPLRRGADALLAVPALKSAEELLRMHRQALDELGRADSRERWEAELVEVQRLHRANHKDEAIDHAARVIAAADDAGWKDLEARARDRRSLTLNTLGRHEESEREALEALRLFQELGDSRGAASAYLRLGDHLCYMTRLHESRDAYLKARELAIEADAPELQAWGNYGLGFVEHQVGRFDSAREHLETSIEQFASIGDRYYEVAVGVTLGDVERVMGNFDRAERLYLAAREIGGGTIRPVVHLNLALLEIARGRFDSARDRARQLDDGMRHYAHTAAVVVGKHALDAVLAALDREHDAWAKHFDAYLTEFDERGLTEFDTVSLGDTAVREAMGNLPHDDDIERAAREVVARWESLGRTGEADALRRLADEYAKE